jgi:hypothetical protein
VVIAIENVRLFQAVERQRNELAQFAPQAADLLSRDHDEQLLAGHRREISALFCDANGGIVEHFAGDGLMAFFNDPVARQDPELAAVPTALATAERFTRLAIDWRKRGYDLGLGVGIATGDATLGRIGFEGRYDYGAVGNVVILAARRTAPARAGSCSAANARGQGRSRGRRAGAGTPADGNEQARRRLRAGLSRGLTKRPSGCGGAAFGRRRPPTRCRLPSSECRAAPVCPRS